MHLLDRVLADEQVTEEEAGALRTTAEKWGLTREDVISAHLAYLESLVVAAVEDSKVTAAERRELEVVAHLPAIDLSILHSLLVQRMKDPG